MNFDTSVEKQKARGKRGNPVGSRNVDHTGTDNDYLTVTSHSHYDPEYRRHIWNATCKTCERPFKIASERVKNAKSCGCMMGKSWNKLRRKQKLEQDTPVTIDLLRKKWV